MCRILGFVMAGLPPGLSISLRGRRPFAQMPEAPVQCPRHQRVAGALPPQVMAEAPGQGRERVEGAVRPAQSLCQSFRRHLSGTDHRLEQVEPRPVARLLPRLVEESALGPGTVEHWATTDK